MKNGEFDFTGHVKNLEDAEAVDLPAAGQDTLTDDELEQAGLVKTSAFIRSKRSKNALRVQKRREKQDDQGVKQLNVEVSDEHRNLIKQMSSLLAQGNEPGQAFRIAANAVDQDEPEAPKSPSKPVLQKDASFAELGEKVAQIKSEGGFRAIFLKLAGV